jgi:hypothetical protein
MTTQFELHAISITIDGEESLQALGSHKNFDLDTQRMEKEILQQKQNIWIIIFVVTFCALIITLIVFKKSPKSKKIEHIKTPQDAGSRLEALNNLLKDNLISQEEYNKKKKEIIETI